MSGYMFAFRFKSRAPLPWTAATLCISEMRTFWTQT